MEFDKKDPVIFDFTEALDDTFYNNNILDNITCTNESTFNLTNGGHRGDCTFTNDVGHGRARSVLTR